MNARIVAESSVPTESLLKMRAKAKRAELDQAVNFLQAAAARFKVAGKPAMQMRVEALMREALVELGKV